MDNGATRVVHFTVVWAPESLSAVFPSIRRECPWPCAANLDRGEGSGHIDIALQVPAPAAPDKADESHDNAEASHDKADESHDKAEASHDNADESHDGDEWGDLEYFWVLAACSCIFGVP